jgi:hypothetical protein
MDYNSASLLLNEHQFMIGKLVRLHNTDFKVTGLELKGIDDEAIVCVNLVPKELDNPPSKLWRELFSLYRDTGFAGIH